MPSSLLIILMNTIPTLKHGILTTHKTTIPNNHLLKRITIPHHKRTPTLTTPIAHHHTLQRATTTHLHLAITRRRETTHPNLHTLQSRKPTQHQLTHVLQTVVAHHQLLQSRIRIQPPLHYTRVVARTTPHLNTFRGVIAFNQVGTLLYHHSRLLSLLTQRVVQHRHRHHVHALRRRLARSCVPHALRQLVQYGRVPVLHDAIHCVLHERVLVVIVARNAHLQQRLHRRSLLHVLHQTLLHEVHQIGRPPR